MARRNGAVLLALLAVPGLLSCGGEPQGDGEPRPYPECSVKPADGVYATFRCVDEYFYVSVTHPDGIAEVIALWEGRSIATIPVGTLVCRPITWNCGWSWYLEPETVRFAEVTIEACQARPSYIETNCLSFGPTYCAACAELVELRDCRTNPACPVMSR